MNIELYAMACLQAAEDIKQYMPTTARYIQDTKLHLSVPFKCLELWNTLALYQPRSIIEIGCGATTCVFAQYAAEYGANVISTEDNDDYAELCRSKLDDLATEVTIQKVPLCSEANEVWQDLTIPLQKIPVPDLLYIDGPANLNGELRGNASRMVEQGICPQLILFDYSVSSVMDFADRFRHKYAVELGASVANVASGEPWYLTKLQHHSFARLRQQEIG